MRQLTQRETARDQDGLLPKVRDRLPVLPTIRVDYFERHRPPEPHHFSRLLFPFTPSRDLASLTRDCTQCSEQPPFSIYALSFISWNAAVRPNLETLMLTLNNSRLRTKRSDFDPFEYYLHLL